MAFYLVRSILCMAVLLLVYLLFLEKEKMHQFNRWYLLGSVIGSFIIPFIIIRISSRAIPVLADNYLTNVPVFSNQVFRSSGPFIQETDYRFPSIIILYLIITAFFLVRFIRSIYKILSRIATSETFVYKGARLVLLSSETISHTFLNNIFVSATDYHSNKIEEEVLIHELAHAKQKHSWDILFIEFLQVFFWFNPLLILYKRSIQLNHEFLADDAVLSSFKNITSYQELLFTKAAMISEHKLVSAFNYSVTKKRFLMMTRTTNHFREFIKQFAVLPLLAVVVFLFAVKSIIAQNSPAPVVKIKATNTKRDSFFIRGLLRNTPFTKEGVSEKVFTDYKTTEQKYIWPDRIYQEEFDFNAISAAERSRLESIFKKMSREQQVRCQLFFTPPLGPIKAEPPTTEQLNRWRNNKIYRVLIGDKRVSTEELENYQASDFASAIVDTKKSADKEKENTYTYQVSLSTWQSHKEMNARLKAEKNFGMGYISNRSVAQTISK